MIQGANMNGISKIALSVAIGGTAESLGGGKFANGAVTGAYVMMLNHLGDHGGGDKKYNSNRSTRPDDDNKLIFGEADGWWKWGEEQPIYIDIDKIDFGNFSMDRFNNPEFWIDGKPGVYIRFDSDDYVNVNQALVIGSVGAVKITENSFMLMPDRYNFDLKNLNSTLLRDAGTILGASYAGWGKSFPMYFNGLKKL